MRRIKVVLLVAVLLTQGCAGWSKKDVARQVTWTGLTVIDWGQSRYIAEHPEDFTEENFFLGPHPSVDEVDEYFAASIILHPVITHITGAPCFPRWLRPGWQYGTIGLQVGVVANNMSIGVGFSF